MKLFKEKVSKEASDVAAAVAGGNGTSKSKKWVISTGGAGCRRKASGSKVAGDLPPAPKRRILKRTANKVSSASSAHSEGEVATSATPTATASLTPAAAKVAPTTVVVAPTPPPATIGTTTWSQMLAEGRRLLEASAREAVAEIERVNARAVSADGRVAELEQELKVTREDLQNMKELVAGNELQRRGLKKRMSNMEDHLASVHDSL